MQGEGQCWHEGVLVLTSPDTAGRGFTVLGRSLTGDRTQTWESKTVAVAIGFVIVDWCLIIQEVISDWLRFKWLQVYNPCRV